MTEYASSAPVPPSPPPARPRRAGGLRSAILSVPGVVVGLALLGSVAFIAYVVAAVSENQISMLAAGFAALGATFVAIAIWSLVAMWRAASRADGGRASGLAIFGGLAGLGAIGCFAVAVVMSLVTST